MLRTESAVPYCREIDGVVDDPAGLEPCSLASNDRRHGFPIHPGSLERRHGKRHIDLRIDLISKEAIVIVCHGPRPWYVAESERNAANIAWKTTIASIITA
jgi:hypothetical protein